MRRSLLYNPRHVIERLAVASQRARRRQPLRSTPAAQLSPGHLDSLELLQLLRPAPPRVAYDIGANVGTWAVLAASLFPECRIECFEPLACHLDGFRKWTGSLPNIRLHPLALGSSSATLPMGVTDFSDASSLLPLTGQGENEFGVRTLARTPVSVVRLDDYVSNNHLLPPDLIKLDIQGYELEALRGGSSALAAARYILIEVSFREFYRGQPLFADVIAFLAAQGFALHALGKMTALGEPLAQADALFVRPGCLSSP